MNPPAVKSDLRPLLICLAAITTAVIIFAVNTYPDEQNLLARFPERVWQEDKGLNFLPIAVGLLFVPLFFIQRISQTVVVSGLAYGVLGTAVGVNLMLFPGENEAIRYPVRFFSDHDFLLSAKNDPQDIIRTSRFTYLSLRQDLQGKTVESRSRHISNYLIRILSGGQYVRRVDYDDTLTEEEFVSLRAKARAYEFHSNLKLLIIPSDSDTYKVYTYDNFLILK